MLNNLINIDDAYFVYENVSRIPELMRRVLMTPEKRVHATWSTDAGRPTSYGMIPQLQKRMCERMSGEPSLDHIDSFQREYLDGQSNLTALALGCGEGGATIRWAQTGIFRRIVAIDVTPAAIQTAKSHAESAGVASVTDFQVADVTTVDFDANGFDCIFADHCLHHFSPLRSVIESINTWLKPEGHLLANEFVGPTRFQWTKRQLEAAQGLLNAIPHEFRIQNTNGRVKRRVPRPSLLRMLIGDPSEAVESSRLIALLDQHMNRRSLREYGGTILHPLLHGIAHHFATDNPAANSILDVLIGAEDALLASGDLQSDFAVGVYGKRC